MRSARTFWGAVILLGFVPMALIYGMLFDRGSDTFNHWVLAAGTSLLATSVFDFKKLPGWLNWTGCLMLGFEAVIFFLQGLSDILQNAGFTTFVYQILGQQLEGWLPRLFMLLWAGALVLFDSSGKTRIFGLVALGFYITVDVVRLSLLLLGASPSELMKTAILLPLVWLILEGRKPAAEK